jgi:integrase
MEKIDIHGSNEEYIQARKRLLIEKSVLNSNAKLILKFLDDSAIGKTASRKARIKSVGVRARLKNLYLLKTVAVYFKDKRMDSLSVKDIEKLVADLGANKIKKQKKTNYSEQTKANIKVTMIIFLRWIYGEGSKKFLERTYWIDTRFKRKSIDYFEEKEVVNILKKCITTKQKVLVCCLMDGGFRIEEFLNIRNSDVTLIEGNAPYYRFKVRTEFSKTKGRDVPMFWSYSYEIIKAWIESKTEYKPDEPFFNSTYDGVRMLLKKIGSRARQEITAHKLRRSSAFWYANSGHNEFQINKKYGWSPGSDVGGKFYIEQSQIDIEEDKQKQKYENTKYEEMNEVLKKQVEENQILKEKTSELEKDFEKVGGAQAKKIKELTIKVDDLLNNGYSKQMQKIYDKFYLERKKRTPTIKHKKEKSIKTYSF